MLKNFFYTLALMGFMLVSTSVATQALAQKATPEGAEKLRAQFQEYMDMQTRMAKAGGDTYNWSGTLVVEPADGYYTVTYPYLKVDLSIGYTIDVGIFASNAAPGKNDNQWLLTTAFPTPIKVYDRLGKLVANVDIGSQRLAGLWHTEANTYMKLDAAYQNIVIKDGEYNDLIVIPELTSTMNLTEADNGLWSGPYTFNAKNVSFSIDAAGAKVNVGDIYANGEVKELNPTAYAEVEDELVEAIEKISDPSFVENNAVAMMELTNFWNTLIEVITETSDTSTVRMGFKDTSISYTNPANPSDSATIALDDLFFSFAMKDMQQELAFFSYGFGLLGMDVKELNTENPQMMAMKAAMKYIPHSFSMEFQANKLPLKQIFKAMGKGFEEASSPKDGMMAEPVSPDFMKEALAIMAGSGTVFTSENTFVKSDMYSFDLQTNLFLNPNQGLPVMGTINLTASGIDESLAAIQQDMQQTQDPMVQMAMMQAQQSLTMMKSMGKPVDGKYVYMLTIKPEGTVMLNDAMDLTAMFGVFMGGMPQ